MTNRNVLYRIFNDAGELLYVGATANPGARFPEHASHQPWWDEATVIKLERLDTWQELIAAETEAIRSENPRHNFIGTHKPLPWVRKPRRAHGEGSIFQRADGLWVGRIELPAVNGKRRPKQVTSKSRMVVERKMVELRALLAIECQ